MNIAEIEELERLEKEAIASIDGCRFNETDRETTVDRYNSAKREYFAALRNSAPDLIALAKWALSAKVAIERNIEGDYEYFLLDALKDFPGGAE